jgi:hypothetical protein
MSPPLPLAASEADGLVRVSCAEFHALDRTGNLACLRPDH